MTINIFSSGSELTVMYLFQMARHKYSLRVALVVVGVVEQDYNYPLLYHILGISLISSSLLDDLCFMIYVLF